KAIRSPNNVAADVERAKKLFKEYTHFVAAVRGASGDMNLYVNGYLIARATPFEPTSNSMSTDGSFQLKGIFKESIDKPTHYFTVKKNASTYITGTADWDKDGFTPVGASFSLTSVPSSKVNTLTAEQQQNKDVSTITTKIEKVIPAQNMIAANRVSLFIKPTTGQQQEKLLAQFAANVGPSENVDNSIGLSIGRTEQYSDPYQGRVKHVSIWKTALEQAEIISYMDSKISENDNSNCVGFWKLETDCKDSTSIGNAGQKESGNTYFIFKDQVLPVYVEEQQKQNWCWAASTLSVIEFYDPMNQLTQSQIVTKKYGTEADQGAWMNDYLKDYYPHHLDHSYFLKDRADLGKGTFISKEDQELDCDFLRKQINNGNPMGLDIQWANGGGHAVMLTGIQPRTGELIINDPWSGLVFITYEDFVNGKYLTNGSWNAVFTTTGSN
ncbi:MAG: C39 family peptidase, partial [Anaerolineales bacterium]|nr:C39 family peptidase [Anaerolineales bacterium]